MIFIIIFLALLSIVLAALLLKQIKHGKNKCASFEELKNNHIYLVEKSPAAIIIHKNKIIIYCNEQAISLLGGEKLEDVSGKNLGEFIHPDSSLKKWLKKNYDENSSNKETLEVWEEKMLCLNGREKYIEIYETSLKYSGKECFSCVVTDITERKNVEDELKRKEQDFRMLATSLPIGLFRMDIFNDLTYTNTKFLEILGLSYEDNFMIDWLSFLHDEDREKLLSGIDDAKTKFRDFADDFRMQTSPEEDTRWVHIRLSTTISDDEISYLGTLEDVSSRKKSERELLEAKKRAEEATKAKSKFLASMSHEIRTPINAVIGMTGLLNETTVTPEQLEYIEIVRSSGEALLSIINDILDFSKIEAGKMELEKIDFNIKNCIEEVGDILASKAQLKGLEIPVLISHNIPEYVKGDPTKLRQILINLVNNAIKFTEKGEVVIKAELDQLGEKIKIKFAVSDTGIGIPEDKKGELFKSFSQLDVSTTRKYGGTGLGLAISQKMVEMMDGTIWVDSKEEFGSTFTFTASFDCPEKTQEPIQYSHETIKHKRILIIESNEHNRLVLIEQLKGFGCITDDAETVDTAMDLIKKSAEEGKIYQAALVGYNHSSDSAETFSKTLRKNPDTAQIKLILLTAMPDRGDAQKMMEAGYQAYLTKPVKEKYLYKALLMVLGSGEEEQKIIEESSIITKHLIDEVDRDTFKILLVEDNVINQKVAVRMLQKLGYSCDIAKNGKEAVEAVDKNKYDLVFMDCQMPIMDGFEATAKIRAMSNEKNNIPIVAMTANVMKGDREECLKAGMSDYLSKPINIESIKVVIDAIEERKKSETAKNIPSLPQIDAEKPVIADEPEKQKETEPPVNIKRITEAAEGDKEFEKELVTMFIDDTKERISKLDLLVKEKIDLKMIKIEAHTIKGSSGNVGANKLREIALTIESMAKEENLEGIELVMAEFHSEFESVKSYLLKFLEN